MANQDNLIRIQRKTYKQLEQFKLDWGATSFDSIVQMLIKEKKRARKKQDESVKFIEL